MCSLEEWNSMGRVDLVWIEVEIVVSTPEKKTTVGVNTISSLHTVTGLHNVVDTFFGGGYKNEFL